MTPPARAAACAHTPELPIGGGAPFCSRCGYVFAQPVPIHRPGSPENPLTLTEKGRAALSGGAKITRAAALDELFRRADLLPEAAEWRALLEVVAADIARLMAIESAAHVFEFAHCVDPGLCGHRLDEARRQLFAAIDAAPEGR